MPKVLSKEGQLRELVVQRRLDADVLYRRARYNGAVYMARYVLECALKAAVCRQLGEARLRSTLAVHDLNILVGRWKKPAGTDKREHDLPNIVIWDAMRLSSPLVSAFEDVARAWTSEMRYETRNVGKEDAKRALEATRLLTDWLNDLFV